MLINIICYFNDLWPLVKPLSNIELYSVENLWKQGKFQPGLALLYSSQ
jgi:hypothetical protein